MCRDAPCRFNIINRNYNSNKEGSYFLFMSHDQAKRLLENRRLKGVRELELGSRILFREKCFGVAKPIED